MTGRMTASPPGGRWIHPESRSEKDENVILYRREWEWVLGRLLKMWDPSLEFRTFAVRLKRELETNPKDPIQFIMNGAQTQWVQNRCKLVSIFQRAPKAS